MDEKLTLLNKKLDKVVQDNKVVTDKVSEIEKENNKLKQVNTSLQNYISELKSRMNNLEQGSRKNCLVINGVKETFAERVADNGDNSLTSTREDTMKAICSVFHETVNVSVTPSGIKSAYRMKSKNDGPRPLLVTFHTSSLRDTVMKPSRPKQRLSFQGAPIYFSDYLTTTNSELFHKARDLVKNHVAFTTWIRDGQLFVKWSYDARPVRIMSATDLIH